MRFGTLLVAAKVATQAQVDDALAAQGQRRMRLGEMLVSMGVLSEPHLNAILDHQFGPICVDIARYPVNDAALALLPAKFARKLGVLPVSASSSDAFSGSSVEFSLYDTKVHHDAAWLAAD